MLATDQRRRPARQGGLLVGCRSACQDSSGPGGFPAGLRRQPERPSPCRTAPECLACEAPFCQPGRCSRPLHSGSQASGPPAVPGRRARACWQPPQPAETHHGRPPGLAVPPRLGPRRGRVLGRRRRRSRGPDERERATRSGHGLPAAAGQPQVRDRQGPGSGQLWRRPAGPEPVRPQLLAPCRRVQPATGGLQGSGRITRQARAGLRCCPACRGCSCWAQPHAGVRPQGGPALLGWARACRGWLGLCGRSRPGNAGRLPGPCACVIGAGRGGGGGAAERGQQLPCPFSAGCRRDEAGG